MLEFILLASIVAGSFIVVAVTVKVLILSVKVAFWALLLPFKIVAGVAAALLCLLLGVVLPILVVVGMVGVLVGLGFCLL